MNLYGKSFLTLKDVTPKEMHELLELSATLKHERKIQKKEGVFGERLKGKQIALIFEKSSTRTRCAFTIGCVDEGGYVEYLGLNDIQLGKKETVEDTARVLGRMFDGIAFRGFEQETVEKLAKYSGVPVWNALTDTYHPTQILADFLTIKEKFGKLENIKLVYVGDGRNNMANSLMIGSGKMGIHMTIIAPKTLWPEKKIVECSNQYAKESGGSITITDNIHAVEGADVIYTDVWCSMGEEEKAKERIELLSPYQVNKELMKKTKKDTTIFMHCLPAVRGNEVTDDVIEGEQSVVFDEAENRLHTIKAVMVATIGNKETDRS